MGFLKGLLVLGIVAALAALAIRSLAEGDDRVPDGPVQVRVTVQDPLGGSDPGTQIPVPY